MLSEAPYTSASESSELVYIPTASGPSDIFGDVRDREILGLAIKTLSAANSAVATRITAVKDFELGACTGSCCNVR